MSWEAINKLLARAVIDATFARKLLIAPLQTIDEAGVELTQQERQVFCEGKANDIAELSQLLLIRLGHEKLPPDDLK